MVVLSENVIHLIGGGLGGALGATITCPLELIKVRLQSTTGIKGNSTKIDKENNVNASKFQPFKRNILSSSSNPTTSTISEKSLNINTSMLNKKNKQNNVNNNIKPVKRLQILRVATAAREIMVNEGGWRSLYKGLIPLVSAVVPSKCIYFYTFHWSLTKFNDSSIFIPNTVGAYMAASAVGGMSCLIVCNPIQVVRTRVQLSNGKMSVINCVIHTAKYEGVSGFYRGFVASSYGISESMITFALYYKLKEKLHKFWGSWEGFSLFGTTFSKDWCVHSVCGGISKFVGVALTYPHEIVRTRTREMGTYKKIGFWRHMIEIYKEGGLRAMYRGIDVQMMRTVPNTAICLATYEMVVKTLNDHFHGK
uniref:Mitochondrial carrier protein n=1 Tax=Parastrongyloides trichosuri TaxID=131310 RepID=A0A0N4ZAY3_PARTI